MHLVDLQCSASFRYIAKWFIYAYTYVLFQTPYSYRLLQNIEQSSLCCIVGPCWLSVYMQQCVYINPKFLIYPSHCFPFGNNKFVFKISESISVKYILYTLCCVYFFNRVTNHVHFEIVIILKLIILKVSFLCSGKYLNTLPM